MSAVEGASKKRRRADVNPIEQTNRKTDEHFIADHLHPEYALLLLPQPPPLSPCPADRGAPLQPTRPDWTRWTHPRTLQAYRLSLTGAGRLGAAGLEACYGLIERTSRADYEASSFGWKPAKKRAEMRSPELRYVLVHDDAAADGGRLVAFTSLMPTYEEGQPVVYCYEVHLQEDLRGYVPSPARHPSLSSLSPRARRLTGGGL